MTSPLERKLKISGPVVVTANRLSDGAVVYRTADNGWSPKLKEALVVSTVPAASELLAGAIADGVVAVGAYVAPVDVTSGNIEPGNLRERIRAQGVTFDLPVTFGI